MAEYAGLLAVLALLVVFFGLRTEHFLSRETFQTIANQIPATVVIAVGMTYVLIIAGIDLSVGSVAGLAGVIMGISLLGRDVSFHLPIIGVDVAFRLKLGLLGAVALALAAGLLCGLLNGVVAIRWVVPSFIVTLGMLEIARGSAYLLTNSQTQYLGSQVTVMCEPSLIVGIKDWAPGRRLPFVAWSGDGGRSVEDALEAANASYLLFSLPFLVAVAIVTAGQLILSRTVFGRYVVGIGTNEEAMRLSGIDPRPVKIAVFAASGLLSALAGVIDTSRFEAADPNAGTGFELQVIAAVVIGGTSLMGGRGSVVASFLGVLIMAVLGAGLAALGAKHETKRIVTGCVIIAAGVLDYYRRRLSRRRAA